MRSPGQADAITDPGGKPFLMHAAQEHLRPNERRPQTVIDSI
jgi:hypothetical protein